LGATISAIFARELSSSHLPLPRGSWAEDPSEVGMKSLVAAGIDFLRVAAVKWVFVQRGGGDAGREER